MQVPKLHKVVVNMGVGAAVADQKILQATARLLAESDHRNNAVERHLRFVPYVPPQSGNINIVTSRGGIACGSPRPSESLR